MNRDKYNSLLVSATKHELNARPEEAVDCLHKARRMTYDRYEKNYLSREIRRILIKAGLVKTTPRRRKNGYWFKHFGTAKEAPCYWCNVPMSFDEATIDHEPALAEGGRINQFVLACAKCNHARGVEVCRRKRAGVVAKPPVLTKNKLSTPLKALMGRGVVRKQDTPHAPR